MARPFSSSLRRKPSRCPFEVLRCLLFFLYFGARFVLDVILAPVFPSNMLGKSADCMAHDFINSIVTMFVLTSLLVRQYRSLALGSLAYFFVFRTDPTTRLMVATTWSLISLLSKTCDLGRLWKLLSIFITFTRMASRQAELENKGVRRRWSTGIRYHLCWAVPLLLRVTFVCICLHHVGFWSHYSLRALHHSFRYFGLANNSSLLHDCPQYGEASPHKISQVLDDCRYNNSNDKSGRPFWSNSGFTAIISECYDGDTCYAQDLQWDGALLPPLFRSPKIRLMGIDAPEWRTAKCPLEKCLAESARDFLEDLLGIDVSTVQHRRYEDDKKLPQERRTLRSCKNDKYGDRIVCDITCFLNGKASSAARAMLGSGLAVPYNGKRKQADWCNETPGDKKRQSHVHSCLATIKGLV